MPGKCPSEVEVRAFPDEKVVRLTFTLDTTSYMKILAMATNLDCSEDAVTSMAIQLGLDLLNCGGRKVVDAVGLRRFLRGDES